MAVIQRLNCERLTTGVTWLQDFDRSLTELPGIAKVQQQLKVAFAGLGRAKIQLEDVL